MAAMGTILILESDGDYRDHLCSFLNGVDHHAVPAADADEALRLLAGKDGQPLDADVLVADAPSIAGRAAEFVKAARKARPGLAAILTCGEAEEIPADAAAAAYRVLRKPLYDAELHFQIKRAIEEKARRAPVPNQAEDDEENFHSEFIGQCPAIKRTLRLVGRIAKTEANVIILGETGTGKELIARTIHDDSLRSDGPFVRVNCAALPEQLLESELFGYERGAFTGADRTRVGRFEHANGGTIFLDEVADMSLVTQAKLLRVCQQKEFERLGSNVTVKTDARIVSATNKDLPALMRKGLFREDLFYRLNVMCVRLPPLRDREGDITLLLQYLLKRLTIKMRRRIRGFEPDALALLASYRWPGNIREMENTLERAVILAEGELIAASDIELFFAEGADDADEWIRLPPSGISLEEAERRLIDQALRRTGGVQKKAAELLGVSPRVLNYKLSLMRDRKDSGEGPVEIS